MNFKSRFLTLSIKEQLGISIILLTIYSVSVILSIFCSFCYQILKIDYRQKKMYFYDRYKEYIEACFYFHNFCLLQYEELLKRMQNQIYKHHQKLYFYNFTSNFDNNYSKQKVKIFDPNDYINNPNNDIYKINDNLFYFCYNSNSELCEYLGDFAKNKYYSFSSIISANNIHETFHIPGYNVSMMSQPLLVNINKSIIFSFNTSKIYQNLIDIFGDYSNYNSYKLNYYYKVNLEYIMGNTFKMFWYYFQDVLFLFDHMFKKQVEEMNNREEKVIINRKNPLTIYEFVKIISGYYTSVKFPINKFSLISYYNKGYYYIEANMIDNYLNFINEKLSDFLDIWFIPLNYENNTIISPELCLIFLLKQYKYQIDSNKIKEIYKQIIRGKSNITDCFIDKNIFDKQQKIKSVLDRNISHFMTINNSINQGILNIDNIPYYFVKYSYPSYSVLKDFKSDYLLLDQVNFYLFASFKEPIEFSNFVFQINKNCFFIIVILILYSWVFCLCINIFIFIKVQSQITGPIKKLQEAIESSSIKDENIFKYEYDDFINELFLTSKELLTGHIDKNNNESRLDNFNILSIHKDKQENIDNNLYQRNLIINNDLLSQLIKEQQNMMDFSNNIKINEEFGEIYELQKKKTNDNNIRLKNNIKLNKFLNENLSNKNNKNQNEEKEREPFKNLFRISEYLLYHKNKVENNYIKINNNQLIKDENTKSNLSKLSSNLNQNNDSLKINQKLKKTFVKGNNYIKNDDNENITINMLDNNDMTYLWYMEEKKKNNKSFNYEINNNYDELFCDCDIYKRNQEKS